MFGGHYCISWGESGEAEWGESWREAFLSACRAAGVPTPWSEWREAEKEAAAVDNRPDPWQPPETFQDCLSYLLGHGLREDTEFELTLKSLQDACRWFREREKEANHADADADASGA